MWSAVLLAGPPALTGPPSQSRPGAQDDAGGIAPECYERRGLGRYGLAGPVRSAGSRTLDIADARVEGGGEAVACWFGGRVGCRWATRPIDGSGAELAGRLG